MLLFVTFGGRLYSSKSATYLLKIYKALSAVGCASYPMTDTVTEVNWNNFYSLLPLQQTERPLAFHYTVSSFKSCFAKL